MVDLRRQVDGLVMTALARDGESLRTLAATPGAIARIRANPDALAQMGTARPRAIPEIESVFLAAVSDDGQVDADECAQLRRVQTLLRLPAERTSFAGRTTTNFMTHRAHVARYFDPTRSAAVAAAPARAVAPPPPAQDRGTAEMQVSMPDPNEPVRPLPLIPTTEATEAAQRTMGTVLARNSQANQVMLEAVPERLWEAVQRSNGRQSVDEIASGLMPQLTGPPTPDQYAMIDAIKTLMNDKPFRNQISAGPQPERSASEDAADEIHEAGNREK